MNRNTAKIKAGIKTLTQKTNEIISGTVVSGSVDTSNYIMSVQPTDTGLPIDGVMLSTISGSDNGVILVPKDNSNVIIGSIDGPGAWVLVKANELEKVIVTIGNVQYEMDNTQVKITNGTVFFNVGSSVFKMGNGSESLFAILNDLLTAITSLTVQTTVDLSPITSTVPTNVTTFTTLQTRLSSLLS